MTAPMTMNDGGQLPLGLRWPSTQRFEHFVVGANALALAACVRAASEAEAPWLFLAGPHGSGKSQLLVAACQQAVDGGLGAQYLPLRALTTTRSASLRGAGGRGLLAIDDINAVAGDSDAEGALFDLYNRSRSAGTTLLFAASKPPSALELRLPDLRSRLSMCTQMQVQPLAESARRELLRERAATRGIALDDKVLDWLFRYHARDMASLAALLDRFDRASLASHRRVTIPFLRDLLE